MMYLIIDLTIGKIVKYSETEKSAREKKEKYLYWERRNRNFLDDDEVIIIKGETI